MANLKAEWTELRWAVKMVVRWAELLVAKKVAMKADWMAVLSDHN